MDCFKNDLNWCQPTTHPLRFIIIGAGVAGLAAAIGLRRIGHQVTIFEQSQKMSEIGAGIQTPPNAARIHSRLGLVERLFEKSTALSRFSIRRYANDEELVSNSLMPEMSQKYGWPMSFIYRGDLQRVMLEAVEQLGIEVRVAHKVVCVDDDFRPRVQVASGDWFSADVVLAADGIRSHIRAQIAATTGVKDRSIPTGDAAYRLLIPRRNIEKDPQCLAILDGDVGIRWIGPGGHIMAYPICPIIGEVTRKPHNDLLNMVILYEKTPNSTEDESWTSQGSKEEMLRVCQGWAPEPIQTFLSFVPEGSIVEWTLNTHTPLPSWFEGSVALMGDACHPQLPYLAQGAAQCLEDAGVLTECFSRTSDVWLALATYELVRKDRAEKIQNSTMEVRNVIHMRDGPEQEARDEKMRAQNTAKPDKMIDSSWQDYMYGVDVMQETRDRWDELVEQVTRGTTEVGSQL